MHHLQKKVIFTLTRKDSARFAELRPENVDGNVFTYHLKQLIADKLVVKTEEGKYKLTQKGKLAGIDIRLDAKQELEQAHSVLFLAAKNKDGQLLLRKRLVHPAYGKVGFLHCEPNSNESIFETAEAVFKERTGLTGKFMVRGSGFVTLLRDSELESFTQFTMLLAENVEGNLKAADDSGENFWHDGNTAHDFFSNMPELTKYLEVPDGLFFTEIRQKL